MLNKLPHILFALFTAVIIWIFLLESYWITAFLDIDANKINRLMETLSFAYVTSYIFFITVVYLKERKDKRTFSPYVKIKKDQIIDTVLCLINELKIASNSKISTEFPTEKELDEMLDKIEINKQPDTSKLPKQFGFDYSSWQSLLFSYYVSCRMKSDELLAKSSFIEPDLIMLLTKIDESHYSEKVKIEFYKGPIKGGTATLKIFQPLMSDYFDLIKNLKK